MFTEDRDLRDLAYRLGVLSLRRERCADRSEWEEAVRALETMLDEKMRAQASVSSGLPNILQKGR